MYKKIISVMSVALVVFLCFSFPAFANTYGASSRYVDHLTLNDAPTVPETIWPSINLTSFAYESDSYNGANGLVNGSLYYKVLGQFLISNTTDQDFVFTGNGPHFVNIHIAPNNNYPSNVYMNLIDYDYLGGQLAISSVDTSGNFLFETLDMDSTGSINPILIPANSKISCYFELTYELVTPGSTSQYNAPTFSASTVYFTDNPKTGEFGDYNENYISYIPDLYDELVDIYARQGVIDSHILAILNAYNSNVPASQDVTSDASSASSTIGNQHQQESNIYSQTNQAIGSTGIQNFQFDNQTIGGLGGVKNDFMAVWNSLGTFNSIFITSLTIGLALSIVRHRRMFKQ